nr:MAG: replication initiator protein [Microvirus sp.]
MLEAKQYKDNAFVTLTYSDEFMPRSSDGRGILSVVEHQNFMKRFRKIVCSSLPGDGNEGRKIRFYGVGEYGDDTWRPHFHYIFFNFPKCVYGQSRYSRLTKNCCYICDMVRDAWGKGNVLVAECSDATTSYTAGYVTKKMTSVDDPRLKGLPPEFARQSNRPGIGRDAMWDVASTLLEFNLVELKGDVPVTLQYGKNRERPLGRYLVRELRKMVGRDPRAPEVIYEQIKAELYSLRVAAFEGSRSFKNEIVEANAEARHRLEVKRKIFRQMRVL